MNKLQDDRENMSLLNAFDFSAIDEMDPSLGTPSYYYFAAAEGHRSVYDREVPFELRIQDASAGPQEVGTLEAIKVKILLLVRKTVLNKIRATSRTRNKLRSRSRARTTCFSTTLTASTRTHSAHCRRPKSS